MKELLFALNLSSGHSWVASFFSNKEQKRDGSWWNVHGCMQWVYGITALSRMALLTPRFLWLSVVLLFSFDKLDHNNDWKTAFFFLSFFPLFSLSIPINRACDDSLLRVPFKSVAVYCSSPWCSFLCYCPMRVIGVSIVFLFGGWQPYAMVSSAWCCYRFAAILCALPWLQVSCGRSRKWKRQ